MLSFFFDVTLKCTAYGVFVYLRSLLLSLGLGEHSLEGFDSLTHASVQGGLDGMEVIVQVLPEAHQETQGLINSRLQVIFIECCKSNEQIT